MENVCNHSFDLSALLKIDDLDIRMIAGNNLSLQASDYYKLLSEFINIAPNVENILNRIAALEGENIDFRFVEGIKELLRSMGCNKLLPAINDIVNSGKMGQSKIFASCAKKLSEDIHDLYTRIVRTMNISEADEPGEYPASIFEKIFPLKKALELLEQEEASRKIRILAIDDSPVMLQTICSVLDEEYKVYAMTNPAMLDMFLEQITPELILLDIEMPGMNGFEVMSQLKSNDSHSKIPVVFLSAMDDAANEAYGIEMGAAGFIEKPFQANILREKVAKHIVKKNTLQEEAA
ncbi:MAG: response regulator [Treponema sp.]|jgi:PleD family two-component response regulator|nr:response regulator [Treponema sp.]